MGTIKFELNILLLIFLGAVVIAFAGLIITVVVIVVGYTLSFGVYLYSTIMRLFGESR